MAMFLYIFVPLGWSLTGFLFGSAISLSLPGENGRRVGKTIGGWCVGLFPFLCLVLLFTGVRGNAGHGLTLFGSEEFLNLLCLSWNVVLVLGIYVVVLHVIRDLVWGSRLHKV